MGASRELKEQCEVALASVGAKNELLGSIAIKCQKIEINSTPTGSEQDTGWDLPAKAVVLDVFIDVTTAEATGTGKTMDVGTATADSGDPDGYLDAVSVASTGVKKGAFAATAGSNNSLIGAAATHTRGAKLTDLLIAGSDADAAAGDGVAVRGVDVSQGGKSIVYKASNNDWAEFRGALYILYLDLDDPVA